ncbi:RICIN domain-containing protein [Aliishimia ponticola]|nr:RICIN domain-containing protein [Aliishimia ponticola]
MPLLLLPTLVAADAPQLQNSGPIIYLSDNLDEPDMLGYCIDTQDRGQTERIQLHSCKPDTDDATGRDVLFSLNADTGRIEHQEYAGFCLTADPDAAATVFGLVTCSDAEDQKFTFDSQSGQIHPADDDTMCLTAAAESTQAGPFYSRALGLDACGAVDAALQSFTMQ